MKNSFLFKFLFSLVFLGSALFALPSFANIQKDTISKDDHLLFVQIAKSGVITPIKGQADTYEITLKHVEPFTSYFTNRPNRKTGLLKTMQFVKLWKSQGDIKQSPPNVALEASNLKDGHRINQVFELSNPSYDSKKNELKYIGKCLNNPSAESTLQDTKIGYTVLFIDDFNWNGNKFGGG